MLGTHEQRNAQKDVGVSFISVGIRKGPAPLFKYHASQLILKCFKSITQSWREKKPLIRLIEETAGSEVDSFKSPLQKGQRGGRDEQTDSIARLFPVAFLK